MLRLWSTALFLTIAISSSVDGQVCNCDSIHPQNIYCTSDFVILATPKFTGQLFDNVNTFYVLDINKILKATDTARASLTKNLVYTPIKTEDCPVTLQLKKEYLLTGHFNGNNLEITSCGLQKKWIFVPKLQKTYIENDYSDTCQTCAINYSPLLDGDHDLPGPMCSTHSLEPTILSCYEQFGICQLVPGGTVCNWTDNKDLKKCLTKANFNLSKLPK